MFTDVLQQVGIGVAAAARRAASDSQRLSDAPPLHLKHTHTHRQFCANKRLAGNAQTDLSRAAADITRLNWLRRRLRRLCPSQLQ